MSSATELRSTTNCIDKQTYTARTPNTRVAFEEREGQASYAHGHPYFIIGTNYLGSDGDNLSSY